MNGLLWSEIRSQFTLGGRHLGNLSEKNGKATSGVGTGLQRTPGRRRGRCCGRNRERRRCLGTAGSFWPAPGRKPRRRRRKVCAVSRDRRKEKGPPHRRWAHSQDGPCSLAAWFSPSPAVSPRPEPEWQAQAQTQPRTACLRPHSRDKGQRPLSGARATRRGPRAILGKRN